MKMISCIVAAVLTGIALGWMLPSLMNPEVLDQVITYVLAVMLFGVGISIGYNRRAYYISTRSDCGRKSFGSFYCQHVFRYVLERSVSCWGGIWLV